MSELRLSERTVVRPGDKIRAGGGPIYISASGEKRRIGEPGVYQVRELFSKGSRVFANASKIDKNGMAAGVFTLFVSGKPFKSRVVQSIVNRPYRVRKVRAA